MPFKVKTVLAGSFGPVRDDIKFFHGDSSRQEMVPSYIFYLESKDMKAVVDMSFSSAEKCRELMGLQCKREYSFEEIMSRNGIDCSQVDMVVCTHLHWDHAGNGIRFPNAQIVCQRDELSMAVAPDKWEIGYSSGFSGEISEVLDRIRPVEGNTVLFEGLEVVKVGGHSKGSQAVIVQTGDGKLMITGDVAMTYRNVKEQIPIGLYWDYNECVSAVKWIKKQSTVYLPSHDWETLRYRCRDC